MQLLSFRKSVHHKSKHKKKKSGESTTSEI
jgi:hypothetical protein